MKVKDYMDEWLVLRSAALAPRTVDQYTDLIRRYINPSIGWRQIGFLSPAHIQTMLADICASGHTRTAELVFVLLRCALGQAVRLRRISCNPCDAVMRPKHLQQQGKAWSDAEILAYLSAISSHKHRLPFLMAIRCGLRRGEICGLRWCDVDFSNRILHVCNQRQRLADGRIIDLPPKSRAGIRDVPIPRDMVPMLMHDRQLSGYVCSVTPSGLDLAHRRLLSGLSLPYIRLHDLRHTMATAATRHGASMRALQQVLGHAHYSTTADRYTHPDGGMLRSVIDRVIHF